MTQSHSDPTESPTRRSVCMAAAVAIALAASFQWVYGDHDLNLRDEGYLWYGVQRVLAGEVPLRDFQAYDPARYYWCAALSPIFGSGIVGVRAAVAVFEAIGLMAGLLVLRRVLRHDAWMIPAGAILMLWMFPRHKLFEHSLTLMGMLLAVRLLEQPSARRHLTAGVFVGLAAFFGRNHGVYLVIALALTLLATLRVSRDARPSPARAAAHGAAGIALGYAPMLAMLAFVPDFASSFFDAVFSVVDRGANVPKDYPWPWTTSFAGLGGFDLAIALALDASFLLPVVVLPIAFVRALRAPGSIAARAPLVAALAVGLPYVHHYSICSDLPHLAQAIMPVLVAALALSAGARHAACPVIATAGLLLVGGLTALEGNTQFKPLRPGAPTFERTRLRVGVDELDLKVVHAATIDRVQRLVKRHLGPDDGIYIAPTMPTFYPVLGKRSPTWWIYYLWPATDEEQRTTIERLRDQDIDWALIIFKPFNDQTQYNFDRTNPIVWRHLRVEWESVDDPLVPPNYVFFRRR